MRLIHKITFPLIYFFNLWGNGSGLGGTKEYCKGFIPFFQEYLRKNRIKSIFDVGCGDWQFFSQINLDRINYTGIDVSKKMISSNTKKYGKENIIFKKADFLELDILPKADLLIIKDVLQHWTRKDIEKFLKKTNQYKKVLIISNVLDRVTKKKLNKDIYVGGQYRPLDLRAPPYNIKANQIFKYNDSSVLLIEHKL